MSKKQEKSHKYRKNVEYDQKTRKNAKNIKKRQQF